MLKGRRTMVFILLWLGLAFYLSSRHQGLGYNPFDGQYSLKAEKSIARN